VKTQCALFNRAIPLVATALGRALLGVFLLVFCLQAHANGEFGRTDRGLTPSGGMQADYKRGSKFTLSENATVASICAYLDAGGGNSGSQEFRFAMYRDDHGIPGAEVAETEPSYTSAGYSGDWFCLGTGFVPVVPGTYWLVIHSGGGAGVVRYFHDGPPNWFGNVDRYDDGASDSFGSGGAGAGTISIYATYFTAFHQAGRRTVGTVPSSGMTTEFKRASSLTVTETGLFEGMTIYLDGLGGATGTELIRLGLYRNANGLPGALVMQCNSLIVRSGELGRWRFLDCPHAVLAPGKYWLALQAWGTSGVARYVLDGTGNWYGNTDPSVDGISDPFGPATAGNGTISGFIHYTPGTATTGRFGRSSIATKPSKGLTADYIRGSIFHIDANGGDRLVNAMYAYLDGNGGASGTQALRMALYYYSPGDAGPLPVKGGVSSVVNIPAGTPPGWVRFPMPPTPLDSDCWITIQSGPTGGVVRDYGDGAPNWRGNTDAFSNGAADTLPGDAAPGTVTLSVYATYDEFHPQ